MITDLNIIATCDRLRESEACSELWMLLRAVDDESPAVDRTRIRGLISARTGLNPLEAIRSLREKLRRNPEGFKALLRVIPVQSVVETDLDAITEASHRMATRMGEGDSYRITVEKRRTGLRSREVIDAVADGLPQRVDLENPDWNILIEIVGNATGVSVIPPDGVLNVQKERVLLTAKSE
jgi:tRNA acetyltransferase TAN1